MIHPELNTNNDVQHNTVTPSAQEAYYKAQHDAIKDQLREHKERDEARRKEQQELFDRMNQNPFTQPTRYY